MLPTSLCFTVLLFSFFIFFSFHSFKYWRTINTHMNQPVKLLSLPIPVDSTRLASMLQRKYRVSQRTHTLNLDFKTYTFRARFSPDQILAPLPGMGKVWFHIFVNISSFFLVCRSKFLALQKYILALEWLGKFLYIIIFCC